MPFLVRALVPKFGKHAGERADSGANSTLRMNQLFTDALTAMGPRGGRLRIIFLYNVNGVRLRTRSRR